MCKCTQPLQAFTYQIPPTQFSLYFGEKTSWQTQGENTWTPPIFSLPSLQPNIHQKNFPPHFLSKVLHPPYSTFKQTHLKGLMWIDATSSHARVAQMTQSKLEHEEIVCIFRSQFHPQKCNTVHSYYYDKEQHNGIMYNEWRDV